MIANKTFLSPAVVAGLAVASTIGFGFVGSANAGAESHHRKDCAYNHQRYHEGCKSASVGSIASQTSGATALQTSGAASFAGFAPSDPSSGPSNGVASSQEFRTSSLVATSVVQGERRTRYILSTLKQLARKSNLSSSEQELAHRLLVDLAQAARMGYVTSRDGRSPTDLISRMETIIGQRLSFRVELADLQVRWINVAFRTADTATVTVRLESSTNRGSTYRDGVISANSVNSVAIGGGSVAPAVAVAAPAVVVAPPVVVPSAPPVTSPGAG